MVTDGSIGVAAKSNPTLSPEERKAGLAAAYTYALLALCSSLLKAGSDLIHLWHGRRQLIRIKAELISAIYNKALRRKDASGVISSKDKDDDDEEDDKDENKKANADTGKVVNLMSSDAGT
jgi:hypothetical protein